MHFISIITMTEPVAREIIAEKSGYKPRSIGRLVRVINDTESVGQKVFVFETSNDVTRHPHYTKARLSDRYMSAAAKDGPLLSYEPDVTVGG